METAQHYTERIIIGLAKQRLRECDGWSFEQMRRMKRTVAVRFSGFNGLKATIMFPRSYLRRVAPPLDAAPLPAERSETT
jgi:hypothetical protein